MPLPPTILQAVADPHGGRIALVLGAGCSFDAPTSIPLSRQVSIDLHDALISDGILEQGECGDPSDLSEVADHVYAKCGTQRPVVERLKSRFPLQIAPPNSGYLIAAALLAEGVIGSIVTLNYDLAMTAALVALGAEAVGIIQGPADLAEQKAYNLYYLHRNANTQDYDEWILRTAALDSEWATHWEPIVAGRVLASPVVIFAGLGTPISVLVSTTTRLKRALPNETAVYLVSRSNREDSKFFTALGLAQELYIQSSWADLMEQMSKRLCQEQARRIRAAITQLTTSNNLSVEDPSTILGLLEVEGVVDFGRTRASWLLHEKPYRPLSADDCNLLADLIHALATTTRTTGATARLLQDGTVEFFRRDRLVTRIAVASGRGFKVRAAIEAELKSKRHMFRAGSSVQAVFVSGTSDNWDAPQPAAPEDIVRGEVDINDIIDRQSGLPFYSVMSVRSEPQLLKELIP